MKLELRKAVAGTHFVICVVDERSGRQIVIPLAPALSDEIDRMLRAQGFKAARLLLPPDLAAPH